MDVSSWIYSLPSPTDWPESDAQLTLQLATSNDCTRAILLSAERTSGSNTEALVTFSISMHGFFQPSANPNKTLWVSNPVPLSSPYPVLLHLLHQLAQEAICRAPTSQDTVIPRVKLEPEPVSQALGPTLDDPSLSRFFNLVFLCRLFWLCVCDAPAEAGSLFFQALAPILHPFLQCKPAMSAFLAAVGADGELLFMRSLGYMLAKWLILREVGGVFPSSTPARDLSFSYARTSHGLWVLKGYSPVASMEPTRVNSQRELNCILSTKDPVQRYSMAHQQLEAVIQVEFSVSFYESCIRVGVRLDNVRLQVKRLSFGGREEEEEPQDKPYADDRYVPSRVRIWVGPAGANHQYYSLTLGRSTENPVVEVDTCGTVKGKFGKSKPLKAKATVRSSTRVRTRGWRWEQDAEGNSAVFDGVLCNDWSGAHRVGTWHQRIGWRGLVFAGDEYGEGVSWRMGREMDGEDLNWRVGGKVWVSYWPGEFKTSCHEWRCVEWTEEVKLPLRHGK